MTPVERLLLDGLADAVTHPGLRVAAVKRTYAELDEHIIRPFQQLLASSTEQLGRYEPSRLRFSLHNGSVIDFVYCERLIDASRRYGTARWGLLLLHEAQLLDIQVEALLVARLRAAHGGPPVLGVRRAVDPLRVALEEVTS